MVISRADNASSVLQVFGPFVSYGLSNLFYRSSFGTRRIDEDSLAVISKFADGFENVG